MDVNISQVNNLSSLLINKDCSIEWSDAIRSYCTNWVQYLNNYDFYIICIWVFFIAGIVGRFWNFKRDTTYYFNDTPIRIELDLIKSIQNISIGALIIRIFQLYYISKIYLGV